jgi:alanyl-tRNA synthetase
VLVSTSTPAFVVIARSGDVPFASHLLLTYLNAEFGGRGGGRSELSQGGGLNASSVVILNAAKSEI